MSAMKRLFQIMADKKASDIFVSVGAPINIKINGIAVPVNQTTMTTETVQQLLYEVLNERQIREFEDEMELNTAYNLAGVGTFRISAFRQKGSPSVVVRYIPASIPPIDTLGLPEVLKEVNAQARPDPDGRRDRLGQVHLARGDARLPQRAQHGAHPHAGRPRRVHLPEQEIDREPARDRHRYQALRDRAQKRAAPGARLHSDRRDPRQAHHGMALAYAQSGHLCLATLHANNSYHAMNRIINFYPLENRPALLLDLAAALSAVISLRLVRTKTGTRVPAVEVLLNTRHIAELIEKGEITEIKEALEKSMSPGSQTFEQSLFKLFMDGKITQDEAMANADSATNMLWLINQATAGEITGQSIPQPLAKPGEEKQDKKEGLLSSGEGASFGNFKIDVNA